MDSLVRRHCLALVLVIFVSQTALLAHQVDHASKGSVKCQLCICQAQQAHGLPVHNFYITEIPGRFAKPDIARPSLPYRNEFRPYFQRAPPVIA